MAETCWRKLLMSEMESNGESMADIESSTMTDAQMDNPFYDGYGSADGCSFTVWTKGRVYFPAQYDGSEWVASVARHPDGEPTPHIGGG